MRPSRSSVPQEAPMAGPVVEGAHEAIGVLQHPPAAAVVDLSVVQAMAQATPASLDLSDPSKAWEWAQANIADIDAETGRDRVDLYSMKYREVIRQGSAQIHRMIVASGFDAIDTARVGTHWSFERRCVGDYGLNRERTIEDQDFVLTGTVDAADIDWEYGLASFVYYGEEQWESSLRDGAPVAVTAVNGQAVREPIACRAVNLASSPALASAVGTGSQPIDGPWDFRCPAQHPMHTVVDPLGAPSMAQPDLLLGPEGTPVVFYHATTREDGCPHTHESGMVFLTENRGDAKDFGGRTGKELMVLQLHVYNVKVWDYEIAGDAQALVDEVDPSTLAAEMADLSQSPWSQDEALHWLKLGRWQAVERPESVAALRRLGYAGAYVEELGLRSLGILDPACLQPVPPLESA